MTDDARRALTEEGRVRIHAARRDGGLCGLCGRSLAEGEPVWMERAQVRDAYRGMVHWRVPVGAECASPASRAAADGKEPEPCVVCGRGIYYGAARGQGSPRRLALCSKRCSGRHHMASRRGAER